MYADCASRNLNPLCAVPGTAVGAPPLIYLILVFVELVQFRHGNKIQNPYTPPPPPLFTHLETKLLNNTMKIVIL